MRTATGLPRLAIPHGFGAPAPLSLSEAASGVCEIVWLVDSSDPFTRANLRVLHRLGAVVDLVGHPQERWAEGMAAERLDGIVAFSDTGLVGHARVAAELGLPFHSPTTAANLTDKMLQRAALCAAGIDVPAAVTIPSSAPLHLLEELARAVSYPAVLKPQHGNDSRLVTRVEDATTLAGLVESIHRGGPPIPLVLEEYLADAAPQLGPGFANYLSVESVVSTAGTEHFAVTGRFPPAEPFRETGFFIPSTVAGADRHAVLDLATAAVGAMGVRTGCLHTELKLTPAGWRVIEVNGRLGGGIPLMLELVTGASPLRMAMRVALGAEPDLAPFAEHDGIGFRLLFQAPMTATVVLGVDGLAAAHDIEGVRLVTLHRGPGSRVSWQTGNHDYVFSVAGVAVSHDELRAIEARVRETVTVTYG